MKIKKQAPSRRKNNRRRPELGANCAPKLPQKYIWRILGALGQDLSPWLPIDLYRDFQHVVRQRDVTGYFAFCEKISLQNFKYREIDLQHLRAIRMLSIAEKFQFDTNETDRKLGAVEKFLSSEQYCQKVNHRGALNYQPYDDVFFDPVLRHAQHFCNLVLGECSVANVFMNARFGPGSDIGTEKGRVHMFDKLCSLPYTVSDEARSLAKQFIYSDQRWLRSLLSEFFNDSEYLMNIGYTSSQGEVAIIQDFSHPLCFLSWIEKCPCLKQVWEDFLFRSCNFNRISTVPKNGKIDRDMAVEPRLNLMLQLGVDGVIRKRLKSFGIDIDDQTKNQRLAEEGSRFGHLATLDLSSASNLISTLAVKTYLRDCDPMWISLIEKLRAPNGYLHFPDLGIDELISYEKVSSMGNGFTFALETLIFSSIVFGVVKTHQMRWRDLRGDITIYGDDIIVPASIADDVIYALRRSGFKVNDKKSFVRGFIRESCGEDFYKGERIRPCYIAETPKFLTDIIINRNRIFERFTAYFRKDPETIVRLMDSWIPKKFRFYGPINEDPAGWLFTVNKPLPTLNLDLQRFEWVLPFLRITRKKLPIPRRKRLIWSSLLCCSRLQPRKKDILGFGVRASPVGDPTWSVFDVIGRNCPMVIVAGHRVIDQWPDYLRESATYEW